MQDQRSAASAEHTPIDTTYLSLSFSNWHDCLDKKVQSRQSQGRQWATIGSVSSSSGSRAIACRRAPGQLSWHENLEFRASEGLVCIQNNPFQAPGGSARPRISNLRPQKAFLASKWPHYQANFSRPKHGHFRPLEAFLGPK